MLQIRVVPGNITENPNAITIVDNPELPLEISVFTILESVYNTGCQEVAIPPMRISTNSHPVDVFDAVLSMKHGIHEFKKQYPESDMILDIVVNNDLDPELRQLIEGFLNI
jgi:hypothetical protein